LKYDVRAPKQSRIAELIKEAAVGRPIVVAGSTVDRINDSRLSEDEMVIQAWERRARRELDAMLVIAPRHPERFGEVEATVMEFPHVTASSWVDKPDGTPPFARDAKDGPPAFGSKPRERFDVVLLDTIGDLAAVYGIADVAFVGGSLVRRGGHNPLEPAQFGVPVVTGPSYENFRGIVGRMQAADAISIVNDEEALSAELIRLLTDRESARAMGERGRKVFEEQQGATKRAVEAIVALVKP
jgi:3-deoxy-D-manno-octulosonic-acid transferase